MVIVALVYLKNRVFCFIWMHFGVIYYHKVAIFKYFIFKFMLIGCII